MTDTTLVIALTVCVLGSLGTMGIGAYLLRGIAEDAGSLVSQLPTRAAEDTRAARESNRRKALRELMMLLSIRALPGVTLVLSGFGLLAWMSRQIMAVALAAVKGLS